MSEKLDRRERDFSKFDSMTTEALQQLLRLDAMKPTGEESDTEELFYIMEVLADRRRNDSTFTGKTAQQAFEDFQKYYMPEDAAQESADAVPERKNNPSVLWLRRLGTLAAALAIVFFTTLTANAFGFDLFGKVAKWSEEFFHFEKDPETTIAHVISPENRFDSLQQALIAYNISKRIAPTRLPEDYCLLEIKVSETPNEKIFYSRYMSKVSSELTITIKHVLTGTPFNVEKSDDLIEIYTVDGIAYYIFQNCDIIHVSWVVENFECLIVCTLPIDTVKDIIDSI